MTRQADRPQTIEERLSLIRESLRSAKAIEDPKARKDSLLNIARELPEGADFLPLYIQGVTDAIMAADEIRDSQYRIHALLSIYREIPGTAEFNPLRIKALTAALNLANTSNQPLHENDLLKGIAKTLPKSCDVSFYRQYTLLGIAKEIPRTGEFMGLYQEAIRLAIAAANTIEEPYYRKYALCYIAEEISQTPELFPLYKQSLMDAFQAASAIVDPVVKLHALIDVLKTSPKTADFYPVLHETLRDILGHYSIKQRMKDITPMEVIDFLLAEEEKGIQESKKTRFTKTRYARILARELEEFGLLLSDIRFIETLKPYTHIWIQPRELRTAIRKIVGHLEGLKNRYHGREVERPVFVREYFPSRHTGNTEDKELQTPVRECISIDLGATNTVIMRKRRGSQPEFITLNSISRRYNEVPIIPTVLGLKTDSIGTAVAHEEGIVNFKKRLLEEGAEAKISMAKMSMERYLTLLYRHLRDDLRPGRWGSLFSDTLTDKVYITAPTGFPYYQGSLKEIAQKVMKGTEVEILEESLAAAIGYQIAGEKDKVVMVIDFGGCTLDVMIVRLNTGEVHVVAKPDKSKMLGGHDIDLWLSDYLSGKPGVESESPSARLLDAAEGIKIALSDSREAPFIWKGSEICKVSRNDLEDLLDRHGFYRTVDRTISHVLWKAEKVGVKKDRIEAVLLTGGSSLIPSFKEKIASIFPALQDQNAIYNHSPFSSVAMGAALYATRNITDRHLGLAYALRYKTRSEETPFAYEIIFEKGESFPVEKTFLVRPARIRGEQQEVYLELFEAPERYIVRRWERESGMEFIKQVIKPADNVIFNDLRIITLSLDKAPEEEIPVTFCVSDSGQVKIRYGKGNQEIETGIRLQ